MDVLARIKRLVVGRRVEFTDKAMEERLSDGLTVEEKAKGPDASS